jgi:D-alanyl-D-alanine carboxypeptidase
MKQLKYLVLLLLFTPFVLGQQFDESKIAELQQQLDVLITPISSSGVRISCKVVHADYNRALYEFHPEEEMIPASITKLLICACAYSKLGKGYDIPTVVYTDDNNITDGSINGNIYLKGYGDPDLNSSDIQYLARNINEKSIKEITGNIVADESFFDNNYYSLSGYYNGDTGPSYWPYVSAISLDKNEGKFNPAISAATLLSTELIAFGVSVQGTVISGSTPKGSKELSQISHPIFDVLAHMCKESDNQSAITIFKLLGAKFVDNPGTLEHGQQVISSFLSEIGIDRYSYEILEGSGLTRFN